MIPVQKVGLGYDVHRFIKGRKLFLGGVEVPYEMGLEGHSDADVLLHAICDALLGAIGQGDIGEHFPDADEQYKNIASIELLRRVNQAVKDAGFAVCNIDSVIIAEEPNLKNFKSQMRSVISRELFMDEVSVNIKATTNEGMGFVGRKEGVAAYATALLSPLKVKM